MDPYCVRCGEVEGPMHFSVCKENGKMRDEIEQKIVKAVNEKARKKISHFPIFWDDDKKTKGKEGKAPSPQAARRWRQMEQFPAALAARGALPRALHSYLHLAAGIVVERDIVELKAAIQIIVVEAFMRMWRERNTAFYEKYKPPDHPTKAARKPTHP